MRRSLAALNEMDQPAFTEALGWIWEGSPWVASRSWAQRPFASLAELHRAMRQVVASASREDQLAIIRAHPDLGTRASVAPASRREQAGAGLDRLSEAEYQHLLALNTAYAHRFGFPFIMAVKGQTKEAILAALDQRVQASYEAEFERALCAIGQIAWFRLEEAVCE
jgi:OHCU decarboxylase